MRCNVLHADFNIFSSIPNVEYDFPRASKHIGSNTGLALFLSTYRFIYENEGSKQRKGLIPYFVGLI
jgi:hypothetical protein